MARTVTVDVAQNRALTKQLHREERAYTNLWNQYHRETSRAIRHDITAQIKAKEIELENLRWTHNDMMKRLGLA